jgi:hypothetical protein
MGNDFITREPSKWAVKWQIGEEFILVSSGLIQILNLQLFECIYVSNVKYIEMFRYRFFGWRMRDLRCLKFRFTRPYQSDFRPLQCRDGFLKSDADAALHCAQMRTVSDTFNRVRMNIHNLRLSLHLTSNSSPLAMSSCQVFSWDSMLLLRSVIWSLTCGMRAASYELCTLRWRSDHISQLFSLWSHLQSMVLYARLTGRRRCCL